jgi:hypothetical protein
VVGHLPPYKGPQLVIVVRIQPRANLRLRGCLLLLLLLLTLQLPVLLTQLLLRLRL